MQKTLMVAAVVVAAGYGAHRWASEPTPAADRQNVSTEHDASLVKDRVWIDHMPKHDRDTMQLFVALSPRPPRQGPQGPIGIFEAVSQWEGHFEAFRHESHGDEMRIVFGQSGDRETLKLAATKCNERGMDYCLDITGSSRGVKRYYSRKGWDVRSVPDAEALATQLAD